MRLTEVGTNVGGDATAEYPAGVLAGDLIVVGVTNGTAAVPSGWLDLNLAGPDNAYTGVADGTGTSVPITYETTGGLSFLQNGWLLSVFRGFRAYEDFAAPTAGELGYPPCLPPVPPGDHRAAVMVVSSRNGTVAGAPEEDLNGAWTFARRQQGGRRSVSSYYWNSGVLPDRAPIPQASLRITGTAPKWQAVAFAVDLTPDDTRPVTRQWPRDSLGLASAPRLYPPPRTNRLVGGHL